MMGDKETVLQPAMEQIFQGVSTGELQAVLDKVFRLDRDGAVEAHQYLHDRKNLGKVVLSVRDQREQG